jgi:hypothetical protein
VIIPELAGELAKEKDTGLVPLMPGTTEDPACPWVIDIEFGAYERLPGAIAVAATSTVYTLVKVALPPAFVAVTDIL